jgi:hypothetical protein
LKARERLRKRQSGCIIPSATRPRACASISPWMAWISIGAACHAGLGKAGKAGARKPNALSSKDVKTRKSNTFPPPEVPPRSIDADYRRMAEVGSFGRLTRDMDGRPIRSSVIVGHRTTKAMDANVRIGVPDRGGVGAVSATELGRVADAVTTAGWRLAPAKSLRW